MKILFALLFCFASLQSFRLLQSCSYRVNRGYAKILLTPYFVSIVVVQVACLLLRKSCSWLYLPLLTVLSVFWSVIKQKTKLVFTKRIIRLLVAQFLLAFGLSLVVNPVYLPWTIPLVACLSLFLCWPIDGVINNYYLYKAMEKLSQSNVKVIAVVGSYGKTTTKDMLCSLLDDCISPKGSCNTPMGIAKFINGTNLTTKYLVLEFGARQVGDIAELCNYFKPQYAIVTGVCAQHLSHFKTLNNVVKTKREVVECLPKDGICVLNANDGYATEYAKSGICKKVLSNCNLTVTAQQVSYKGTQLNVCWQQTNEQITLPQISDYVDVTFCMCAQMCLQLGQSLSTTLSNVSKVCQTPHRMQLSHNGSFYILDDSYNASIKGVQSCYTTLNKFDCTKVAITQGIVEGGKQNASLNVLCGKYIGDCCNYAIVLGKNTPNLLRGLESTSCQVFVVKNMTEAVKVATRYVKNGILLFQNDLPDVINI